MVEYFETTHRWWECIAKTVLQLNHSYCILHRDLKPENILLIDRQNENGFTTTVPVIADLGLSKYFGCAWDYKRRTDSVVIDDNIWYSIYSCGYRAPELWHSVEDIDNYEELVDKVGKYWKCYDEKAEAWAVGCILFDMVSKGHRLFSGKSLSEVRHNIKAFSTKNYGMNELPSQIASYGSSSKNSKSFISLNRLLERALYNVSTGVKTSPFVYNKNVNPKITGSGESLSYDVQIYFRLFASILGNNIHFPVFFIMQKIGKLLHPNPLKRSSLRDLFPTILGNYIYSICI